MKLAMEKAQQVGLALVKTAKGLQMTEPEQKPLSWQEMAEQLLARQAAKYAANSQRIAAQYNLDVVADKNLISEIIAAEGLQKSSCANCGGVNCSRLDHIGQIEQIVINEETRNGAKFPLVTCPKWAAAHLPEKEYQSGLPQKYSGVTLSSLKVEPDNEQGILMAGKHLETCQDSLFLYGVPGCGKTMLSVLIGKAYLQMGKTVAFQDVVSLLADLQSTFNDKSKAGQYWQIMERCKRCDLLILDDMGAEKISEWTVKMMQELINARYNAKKPLIMTSNYEPDELLVEFSRKDKVQAGRIASRLKEMAYFVCAGNKDRRPSKAISF